MTTPVFVLQHVHTVSDGEEEDEDIKLIGVYSTDAQALAAISRLSTRPGFRDHLDGFHISPLTLDKDQWSEGFVRWREVIDDDKA
jgi:hypothetical protein